MSANPLHTRLVGDQIGTLVPKRDIVHLKPTDTVGQAMVVMNKHRITAIPVADETKLVGFLDMVDVAAYTCDFAKEQKEGQVDLEHTRLSALKPGSKYNFMSLDMNPVYSVMEVFAQGGQHRCALFDADGQIRNVVSQSDVCRYLWKLFQTKEPGSALENASRTIVVGSKGVDSVKDTDTVFTTLELLASKKHQSVAIVDTSGKLVGNFSVTDMRALDTMDKKQFEANVLDFLKATSPRSLSPCAVKEQQTIYAALETVVREKIHGIWIVDGDGKPTSRVSLSDIIGQALTLEGKVAPKETLKLPGTLQVTVKGAADLASNATHAVVSWGKDIHHETEKVAASIVPDFSTKEPNLKVVISEGFIAKLNCPITVKLMNGSSVVGTKDFALDWIVSGFGTNSSGKFLCEDTYALKPKGAVEVNFLYTPQ